MLLKAIFALFVIHFEEKIGESVKFQEKISSQVCFVPVRFRN